jgi:hypothetical protein
MLDADQRLSANMTNSLKKLSQPLAKYGRSIGKAFSYVKQIWLAFFSYLERVLARYKGLPL